MNLGRIKTFLIILFLGINIYLIFSTVAASVFTVDDETVSNTVKVLKQSGIYSDESIIPKRTENLKNIETQNLIYSKTFKNGKYYKDCIISGDTFELEIKNAKYTSNEKGITKFVKNILAELGVDKTFVKFTKINKNDSKISIDVMCNVKKFRIFDSNIKFDFDRGNVKVKGCWYEPLTDEVKVNSKSREVMYATGILVGLLTNEKIIKSVPVTIKSIDIGYMSGSVYGGTGHITATAVPYYKIVDSRQNVYYYDATDGSYFNK